MLPEAKRENAGSSELVLSCEGARFNPGFFCGILTFERENGDEGRKTEHLTCRGRGEEEKKKIFINVC